MSCAIRFVNVTRTFRANASFDLKDRLLSRRMKRPATRQQTVALAGVSFDILSGQSTAVLGHNGSGKSTLLKLMAGTLIPTAGTVTTQGRIAPLLELGAGFHGDLTGRENVMLNGAILGVPRRKLASHMDGIVEFAGLQREFDLPLRTYSSGMAARLGFAVAVSVDADILLVDELLAVGDTQFRQRAEERMTLMRDEGRTIILVTHSLDQARRFCQRAIVLTGGRVCFDGSSSDANEASMASIREV